MSTAPMHIVCRHKTMFHWSVWSWTCGEESLFDLTPFQLELFNDFVREASAP